MSLQQQKYICPSVSCVSDAEDEDIQYYGQLYICTARSSRAKYIFPFVSDFLIDVDDEDVTLLWTIGHL